MLWMLVMLVLLMAFALCMPNWWRGGRWGFLSSAVSAALFGVAVVMVFVAPL